MTNWFSKRIDETYDCLKTNKEGLSSKETEKRLVKYGANELKGKPKITVLQMFLAQLKDKMIMILLVASILSFVLGERLEGIVILFIILINCIVSVIQEKKAFDAVDALRNMNAPTAHVIRDGDEKMIKASTLVPGDIVYLEDGSIVPADLRLIETNNLKINEASLTGESVSVLKNDDVVLKNMVPLGDQVNMAFSSSIVTYGTGVGVVVSTGMNSEVGKIAKMLDDEEELESPLKRKLNEVGKLLSVVGVITSIIIFIIGLLYGKPVIGILMIAISLAISVIPEGLPSTATIVMALGVERMAKKNALVKRLPAVETLGSASVICTDKTGTLTKNKMTVTAVCDGDDLYNGKTKKTFNKKTSVELFNACCLCNNASIDNGLEVGDPTEVALLNFAEANGFNVEKVRSDHQKLFEQPFDSERKTMSTVHEVANEYVVYTKGAPDELLKYCDSILIDGVVKALDDDDKKKIKSSCEAMSMKALRTLGFAKKNVKSVPNDGENIEFELTFLGMVGMIDPPRKEVIKAIKTCHRAGIKVVMITGDHKITATEIAKELGIFKNGNEVITGDELSLLTDEELEQKINNTTVFARVDPSDKLKIVNAFKRNGEVVAMTGDGVNDSPALKAADIGIAMGITGTDVAKDAADMILLDDNFTTIEQAIREGRRVYRNIQKVVQFLVAGNIAEVLTILIAMLFNWQTPILAVHILVINLVTDTLPALALGVDPENKNNMKHKPTKMESIFDKNIIRRVVFHGILITLISLGAYRIGMNNSYEVAVSMTFLTLSLSQVIHSLNQHSNTTSIFSKKHPKNLYLYGAMGLSLVVILLIFYVPALKQIFGIINLSLSNWIIVIVFSFLPLIVVELVKAGNKLLNKNRV